MLMMVNIMMTKKGLGVLTWFDWPIFSIFPLSSSDQFIISTIFINQYVILALISSFHHALLFVLIRLKTWLQIQSGGHHQQSSRLFNFFDIYYGPYFWKLSYISSIHHHFNITSILSIRLIHGAYVALVIH